MPSYKDQTFCASPNCENKCGRKPTPEELAEAERTNTPMMWGYYCYDKEPKHCEDVTCKTCIAQAWNKDNFDLFNKIVQDVLHLPLENMEDQDSTTSNTGPTL